MIKKTVCVDVDGVLAVYDKWEGPEHFGEPITGAREFLTQLREYYEVAIHTTRLNPEVNEGYTQEQLTKLLTRWLKKHKLPYDKLVSKPIAIAYVDDRAIQCTPQRSLKAWDYFAVAASQIQMLDPTTKFRYIPPK